ncbi:hypothetical protein PPUJ20066_25160 [Pseudomonas putida]|nr:hypothetical protein PPUJ20066_25160 [Pseudomonas putida]
MKPVIARASRPLKGKRSALSPSSGAEEVWDIAGCLEVVIEAGSVHAGGIAEKDGYNAVHPGH